MKRRKNKRDFPRKPIRSTEPKWHWGFDFYDWLCPSCKCFLAAGLSQPNIPKRCPECGQKIMKLTHEDMIQARSKQPRDWAELMYDVYRRGNGRT